MRNAWERGGEEGSSRAPRMSLAILLPTYDAYAPVARFTLGRLDACWPGHPEVFVCGIAGSPMPSGKLLPLAADPRDWVGIALDAVRRLEEAGRGVALPDPGRPPAVRAV